MAAEGCGFDVVISKGTVGSVSQNKAIGHKPEHYSAKFRSHQCQMFWRRTSEQNELILQQSSPPKWWKALVMQSFWIWFIVGSVSSDIHIAVKWLQNLGSRVSTNKMFGFLLDKNEQNMMGWKWRSEMQSVHASQNMQFLKAGLRVPSFGGFISRIY